MSGKIATKHTLSRVSCSRSSKPTTSPFTQFTGEELQVKFLADSEENSLKH
jgi:hypothetical protein